MTLQPCVNSEEKGMSVESNQCLCLGETMHQGLCGAIPLFSVFQIMSKETMQFTKHKIAPGYKRLELPGGLS